jgi:hypothetical protein
MSATPNPNLDGLMQYLENAYNQAKQARINALTYFQQIQTTNNSLLQNELKIMAKTLGKKDPNIVKINNCIKQTNDLVNRLGSELQIAKIRISPVSENQTLIYGRVTDANLQGIQNLTISLVDNVGKSTGFSSITDPSGYYAIVVDNGAIKQLESKAGGIYLNAHTQDNVLVHDSPNPVKIQTGINQYHVTIPDIKKVGTV